MNAASHEFSLCTKQNGISPNYNILLCNWKSNILRSGPVPHLLSLCLPLAGKNCSWFSSFIQSLRQAEESRQTVKDSLVCVYCPLQKYLVSGFQGFSSSGPGQGNYIRERQGEGKILSCEHLLLSSTLHKTQSPTHSPVGQVELHPLEGPCAPYPDVKILPHALPAGSSVT